MDQVDDTSSLAEGGAESGLGQLIAMLRTVLSTLGDAPPYEGVHSRTDVVRTLTAAVTQTGIDGEALIRYGLTVDVAAPIAIGIAFDQAGHEVSFKVKRWRTALGLDAALNSPLEVESQGEAISTYVDRVLPVVIQWVERAPFDDIAELRPPCEQLAAAIAEGVSMPMAVTEEYEWVIDRLSGESISTWRTGSLENEYRWQKGKQTSSLPESAMVDVAVSPDEIAVELADRTLLSKWGTASDPQIALAAQVDQQARIFLQAGRFSDAAALFEFMGSQPAFSDHGTLNNRGFCLIPGSPTKALHYLQEAAAMGYKPAAVNVYNQLCCHQILGDISAFRSVSEYYWAEQFDTSAVSATLWAHGDGDEWKLQSVPDARESIAVLAIEVAAREGWPAREKRWKARLDGLRRGDYVV